MPNCLKCKEVELEKDYVVVGHNWNFRHPTEWEMRQYYYKCNNCKEEYDLQDVEYNVTEGENEKN